MRTRTPEHPLITDQSASIAMTPKSVKTLDALHEEVPEHQHYQNNNQPAIPQSVLKRSSFDNVFLNRYKQGQENRYDEYMKIVDMGSNMDSNN